MLITSSGRTHSGHVRDHNEDAFLIDESLGLYVVCDGMGGHEGGEVASAEAVRALCEALAHDDGTDLEAVVERGVLAACAAVFHKSQAPGGKRGMGCTLSMLLIRDGTVVVGHAGDSRIYRKCGDQITQLTSDHTWVQQCIDAGKMTEAEAIGHPKEHALINAVGLYEDCEVDVASYPLVAGDRFVVCSDGLSNYLTGITPLDWYLGDARAAEAAAHDLVDWVLQGQAHDNTTVIVIDITDSPAPRAPRELFVSWPTVDPNSLCHLQRQPFRQGEVLVQATDTADRWFVVVEGALELRRWGQVVRQLGPGHSAGADGLLTPHPARGELRATTDGVAVVLSRPALDALSAEARASLLGQLATHLVQTARQVGFAEL